LHIADRALDAQGHPGVEVDGAQHARVFGRAFQPLFGDETKRAVRCQAVGRLAHRAGLPEVVQCSAGLFLQAALLGQLGEDHVPRTHAHDEQDQQCALGHQITLRPEGRQAVGVVFGEGCRHRRRGLESLRQHRAGHAQRGQQAQTSEGFVDRLEHLRDSCGYFRNRGVLLHGAIHSSRQV